MVCTNLDTKRAILATAVPLGLGAVAFHAFAADETTKKWFEAAKKPSWASEKLYAYAAADALTLAPLGYASYLVFKNGGGFDYTDTRVALGLYAVNLGVLGASIPVVRSRNYKCLFWHTVILAASSAATFLAFRKIDERAGLLALPFAAWTGFYVVLTHQLRKLNGDK